MPSNLIAFAQKELLGTLLSQQQRRVFPLSLTQRRFWFQEQRYRGNPAYDASFGFRQQGNPKTGARESIARELVQRQKILCTIFETYAGHPVQVKTKDATMMADQLNEFLHRMERGDSFHACLDEAAVSHR